MAAGMSTQNAASISAPWAACAAEMPELKPAAAEDLPARQTGQPAAEGYWQLLTKPILPVLRVHRQHKLIIAAQTVHLSRSRHVVRCRHSPLCTTEAADWYTQLALQEHFQGQHVCAASSHCFHSAK